MLKGSVCRTYRVFVVPGEKHQKCVKAPRNPHMNSSNHVNFSMGYSLVVIPRVPIYAGIPARALLRMLIGLNSWGSNTKSDPYSGIYLFTRWES